MHGGHQAALDAPFVVQHFGDGSQRVGGAAGVADDGLPRVGRVVDPIHKHGGVVFGRRGHHHLFGTGCQVFARAVLVQK